MTTEAELRQKIFHLETELESREIIARQQDEHIKRLQERVTHAINVELMCVNALRLNTISLKEEDYERATEYLTELVRRGTDFNKLLSAIKKEPMVSEAWENLLLMMRMCGLDEQQ